MEKMEKLSPAVDTATNTQNLAQRAFNTAKNNSARILAAGTIGAMSLLAAGCGSSHNGSPANPEVTASQAKANCTTFNNANSAADSSKYNSAAFLPKGTVDSNTTTKSYIKSLFGSNGPLAGKGDIGSLAAITSAITVPSENGTSKPNTYNYQDQFAVSVASFSSVSGGNEAQQTACNSAFTVMNEDGNWNSNWAGSGQVVTQLVPTRDTSNNHIKTNSGSDLILEQVHLTGSLKGVEFKSRKADKPGYNSVLITDQGYIYVQGIISLAGNSSSKNGNGSTANTGPNGGSSNTGGNGGNGTGSNSGNNGNSGGGSGSGSNGNGGGNGGNGGGSGETTTTTIPTPPTTTTTTIPETTTTLPKGPNPGCTPNPPYVICN